MFCPRPTTCINDQYKRTDKHMCAYSHCCYPEEQAAMIHSEIDRIESMVSLTLEQLHYLYRLYDALNE